MHVLKSVDLRRSYITRYNNSNRKQTLFQMRNHTVLPATHSFIHKWNEPYLLLTPAAEHHRTLAGTHFPVPLRVGGCMAW